MLEIHFISNAWNSTDEIFTSFDKSLLSTNECLIAINSISTVRIHSTPLKNLRKGDFFQQREGHWHADEFSKRGQSRSFFLPLYFVPPPVSCCALRGKRKRQICLRFQVVQMWGSSAAFIPTFWDLEISWRFLSVNCQVLISENIFALGFWLWSVLSPWWQQAKLRYISNYLPDQRSAEK